MAASVAAGRDTFFEAGEAHVDRVNVFHKRLHLFLKAAQTCPHHPVEQYRNREEGNHDRASEFGSINPGHDLGIFQKG